MEILSQLKQTAAISNVNERHDSGNGREEVEYGNTPIEIKKTANEYLGLQPFHHGKQFSIWKNDYFNLPLPPRITTFNLLSLLPFQSFFQEESKTHPSLLQILKKNPISTFFLLPFAC